MGITSSAVVLFILGILSFNTMEAIVKSIPPEFEIWTILLYRYLFGCLFLTPAIIGHRKQDYTSAFKSGAVRGVLAFASAGCFFSAVRLVPLAEASALIFSSPLFSQVMAVVVLREPRRRFAEVSILLGSAGVACIFCSAYAPGNDVSTEILGLWLALCSAFIFSLMLVVSKRQVDDSGTKPRGGDLLVVGAQSATGLAMALPVSVTTFTSVDPWTLLKLACVGALASAGLLLITASFRVGKMSHVAIYQFTGVFWATFYGIVFYNETFTKLQIVGVVLILSSILWLELCVPILDRSEVMKWRHRSIR